MHCSSVSLCVVGMHVAGVLFHSGFCLQADGRDLVQIFYLLCPLLEACHGFIPAAIEANVTADAIRLLRTLHRGPIPELQDPSAHAAAVHFPLQCLLVFMACDMRNARVQWGPATDAKIVSVFNELLALGSEATVNRILLPLGGLLAAGPGAKAVSWAPRLARAIAQLLTANPPVALCEAATVLCNIGRKHPQFIVDCHTWGIEARVQQLAVDKDPAVAAAADQLWKLLFCGNQDREVR
jgi:hypothetical protein